MAITVSICRDAGAPVATSATSKPLAANVAVSRAIVVSTSCGVEGLVGQVEPTAVTQVPSDDIELHAGVVPHEHADMDAEHDIDGLAGRQVGDRGPDERRASGVDVVAVAVCPIG